jgi:hypothetical protein
MSDVPSVEDIIDNLEDVQFEVKRLISGINRYPGKYEITTERFCAVINRTISLRESLKRLNDLLLERSQLEDAND